MHTILTNINKQLQVTLITRDFNEAHGHLHGKLNKAHKRGLRNIMMLFSGLRRLPRIKMDFRQLKHTRHLTFKMTLMS